MELGGRTNYKRRGKAIQGNVLCFCGFPPKIAQAWTDQNLGRKFYECERYKCGGGCNCFRWFDEEEGFGWQKQALRKARNEILVKKKTIAELEKKINKFQTDFG